MPIPNRTQAADYHYHVYDYNGAQEWQAAAQGPALYNLYSLYVDLQGLVREGNTTHIPNLALVESQANIRSMGGNLKTLAIRLGNRLNVQNSPVAVITGGVHAREWIGIEMAYLLAEYLIKNYEAPPAMGQNYSSQYAQTLSQIIDSRTIYIFPMVNPSGHYFSVYGPQPNARDWRKNRRVFPSDAQGDDYIDWLDLLSNGPLLSPNTRPNPPLSNIAKVPNTNSFTYQMPYYPIPWIGNPNDTVTVNYTNEIVGVDLNRNNNTTHWGNETAANDEGQPTRETYFGTNRSSEQELKNLVNILNGVNVDSSIDYHSYGRLILYPEESPITQRMTNLGLALQRLIELAFNAGDDYDYRLGTAYDLLNYRAVGTIQDYMAVRKNSTAFTIELDPANQNPGFQLPENQIQAVFETNIRTVLALIAAAGIGQIQTTSGGWFGWHDPQTPQVRQFLGWNVFGRGNRLPV